MTTLIILGSGMSECFAPDELDIISQDSGVTVAGHSGRLAMLRGSDGEVMLALGRRHLYEGHSLGDMQAVVHHAATRGARNLIVTNAAGGLNPHYSAGEIMLITDILGSLVGRKMVIGLTSVTATARNGVVQYFDTGLYDSIESAAMEQGISLHRGTYAVVSGPNYETGAEIRMLRRMGADAVGMSTLPEVMAAKQASMRVVGLSLITNMLTDTVRVALDHTDVVEQGRRSQQAVRAVLDAALSVVVG